MPTELNPTNAFGELLLDLLEAQYGDLDSGIGALVETTGLGEDEITAIIQGDVIVEDETLLSSIVDAFPDADENDVALLVDTAVGVDEEDRASLEAEIGATEDELEAGENEMPVEEENYSMYDNSANFGYSYPTADFGYLGQRINQLESNIADFNQRAYVAEFSNMLADLDYRTSQAVQNGTLPPACKTMLIGNFADPTERVVEFSKLAEANGVDPETMAFAVSYAFGLLENASRVVDFQDYSVTQEEIAAANFSASLDAVVDQDIQAIFSGSAIWN